MYWCQALPWRKTDLFTLRGKLDHMFCQEKNSLFSGFWPKSFHTLLSVGAGWGGRVGGRNSVDTGVGGSVTADFDSRGSKQSDVPNRGTGSPARW